MDFKIIKISQIEESNEILFDTRSLEQFTLDQLAALYEEVKDRMNKRILAMGGRTTE